MAVPLERGRRRASKKRGRRRVTRESFGAYTQNVEDSRFISGTSVSPYIVSTPQSTKSQKKQVELQKPETKTQKREKRTLSLGGKDFKVKKGAEVAAKVRKLKDSIKNVRAGAQTFRGQKANAQNRCVIQHQWLPWFIKGGPQKSWAIISLACQV